MAEESHMTNTSEPCVWDTMTAEEAAAFSCVIDELDEALHSCRQQLERDAELELELGLTRTEIDDLPTIPDVPRHLSRRHLD